MRGADCRAKCMMVSSRKIAREKREKREKEQGKDSRGIVTLPRGSALRIEEEDERDDEHEHELLP